MDILPTGALAEGTQSVTIVYTEGGVSAQASQAITVQKASFAVPSQGSPLVYTGGQQSPDWTGYDSAEMTIGGTSAATDAGTYQAIFSLKDKVGTEWADGTTDDKSVSWSIGRASLSTPAQSGSLTYNGSAQSPSWNGYDSSKMTMGEPPAEPTRAAITPRSPPRPITSGRTEPPRPRRWPGASRRRRGAFPSPPPA